MTDKIFLKTTHGTATLLVDGKQYTTNMSEFVGIPSMIKCEHPPRTISMNEFMCATETYLSNIGGLKQHPYAMQAALATLGITVED